MAVILMLLQALDLATTAAVLALGGEEKNPVVLNLGWTLTVCLKFIVTCFIILYGTPRHLFIAASIMTGVVALNSVNLVRCFV